MWEEVVVKLPSTQRRISNSSSMQIGLVYVLPNYQTIPAGHISHNHVFADDCSNDSILLNVRLRYTYTTQVDAE
jgi:hypothetical protein